MLTSAPLLNKVALARSCPLENIVLADTENDSSVLNIPNIYDLSSDKISQIYMPSEKGLQINVPSENSTETNASCSKQDTTQPLNQDNVAPIKMPCPSHIYVSRNNKSDDKSSSSVRRSGRTKKPKYSNIQYHYTSGGLELTYVENRPVNIINMMQSQIHFGLDKPTPRLAKLHCIKYYKKFDAYGDGRIEKLYDFVSDSDDAISERMKIAANKTMRRSKAINHIKPSTSTGSFHNRTLRSKGVTRKPITMSNCSSSSSHSKQLQRSKEWTKGPTSKSKHHKGGEGLKTENQHHVLFESNTSMKDKLSRQKSKTKHGDSRSKTGKHQQKKTGRSVCQRPLSPFSMAGLSEGEVKKLAQQSSNDKEKVLRKGLDEISPYERSTLDDDAIAFASTDTDRIMDYGLIVVLTDKSRSFMEVETSYLELKLLWGDAVVVKQELFGPVSQRLKRDMMPVVLNRGTHWTIRAVHSTGCIVRFACPFDYIAESQRKF